MEPTEATPEDLFRRAATSIFHKWTAINLAIHNEWGGRNAAARRDEMIEELFELMLGRESVYMDEVQDFLFAELDSRFLMVCEDGSVEDVSEILMSLHRSMGRGELEPLLRVIEKNEGTAAVAVDACVGKEEEGEGNEEGKQEQQQEQQEEPQPQQQEQKEEVVDPDGWQTVSRKKKKKSKKNN